MLQLPVVGGVLQLIITFLCLSKGAPLMLLVVTEQVPLLERAAFRPDLLAQKALSERKSSFSRSLSVRRSGLRRIT